MRTSLAITSGILALLIAGLPAQAADSNPPRYTETFEGDDSCVGGVCDPSSVTYTYSKSNMNAFVSAADAHAGTMSLRATSGLAGANSVSFVYNGINWCAGTSMKVWFKISSFTEGPFTFQQSGTFGDWISARVASTGSLELASLATGATVTANTWTDITFNRAWTTGTSLCDGSTHNSVACISSTTLGLNKCNAAVSSATSGSAATFSYSYAGTPGTTVSFLDDMGPLTAFSTASANNIFCSNVIEDDTVTGAGDHPNYGYNYRRGGAYFNQEDGDVPGIGLSTGYQFEGDSSEANWDYTAKDFSTGTKAVHVNMTLEAALTSSTVNSVFRVNMMTVSGANSDATTKGNGLNTGLFSDHAEAQFAETSNAWQVTFWYVTGGGTRTQLGAAASVGSSHDATPFTIWMDTRSTAFGPPNSGFQGTGGTITAGPYIAVTIPQESTGGEDNTIVGFRSLPTAFSEDTIFNVWNVGYGSASTATTAVDENIQVGDNTDDEGAAIGKDSTCIFDDVGTAVARGSQGSAPDSTVPDFTPNPDPDGDVATAGGVIAPGTVIPDGWTVTAFNGFLGVLLMFSIGGGAWATFNRHWVALLIGSLMGFILALLFQLFSLGILIVVVVIGVAIIFLAIKRSAGASG